VLRAISPSPALPLRRKSRGPRERAQTRTANLVNINGAPEEIRTPDPQIRSLNSRLDSAAKNCKPKPFRPECDQGLSRPIANRNQDTCGGPPGSKELSPTSRARALSQGTRSAGRCTVTNRFEAVNCQACGRKVKRQSRRQRFCSDRCRDWNKGQKRVRKSFLGGGTTEAPKPLFLSSKNKELQGRKSGSSIPLNILGGHRWPNAGGVDRELLRKIVRAEIGDTR
jgi:endogenous inhibitor of DNA gyrase (YacG/DUF329 family)